ncbi:baseplate assembly protein [Natronospirillum operosum]|uniref:Baseplate assembly protein n=1 Tax=Natronospirillum operosum TaxID=2759953 RepID=A0A4Z0WEF0_9GAMM|nr:baseplate J/gp47 family protein [Natronospirillum operosum]TGG92541.1 baseplate assembly protein [Natronospirillum operosum]
MSGETEFTTVDLSRLPAPQVIEELSVEAIFQEQLADYLAQDAGLSEPDPSDPAYKQLLTTSYREFLVRQRVNEAARGVMLAHAKESDLEQLGAFYDVERLMTDPGDPDANPPVAPSYESDEELLRRIQAAMHGFSIAGPERAYIFHGLSADGDVLDISADSPEFAYAELDPELQSQLPPNVIVLEVVHAAGLQDPLPGDVALRVLSRIGDGTASPGLVDAVESALTSEAIRPLTDRVRAQGADIVHYEIEAELFTYSGAGAEVALQEAISNTEAFVDEMKRLGRDIYRSAITAELHVPGVERVNLISPAADIVLSRSQAAHCLGVVVHDGVANG